MRKPLLISAYLILTFHNQYAVISQDAVRLAARTEIKIKDGGVIFRAGLCVVPVGVMVTKRGVFS